MRVGSLRQRCRGGAPRGVPSAPALAGDYDVDRLRRELRGPASHASCRELAGRRPRGPDARPLRGRRAPDLGLRRADRLARGARARGLDPPDVRRARASTRPHTTARFPLPWTFSTFDYRDALRAARRPERRRVRDRDGRAAASRGERRRWSRSRTDRGEVSAPLVVDALGWRRVLGATATSRRTRRSRAASRCIPTDRAASSRSGSTARSCPRATAGASRPTTRCGSASARSTRASTSSSRRSTSPSACAATRSATRATGSPTSCATATDGERLLRRRLRRPLPAADRGGHPHRLLLRHRAAAASCARCSRAARRARRRCAATPRSRREHELKFRWMLRAQRLVPRVPPRAAGARDARRWRPARFTHWAFDHYLKVAPPELRARRPAAHARGARRLTGLDVCASRALHGQPARRATNRNGGST